VNYLVDTHCLIWSLFDPEKMDRGKREILLDPVAVKYVSKISYWEIALKYALGKLELTGISPENLLESSVAAGYEILDISEEELVTSYKLPRSATHKDPFDRLLVWQCIRNDLVFITADSKIKEYAKNGLRIFK
jgi:PIN domain nuclease of toxin-antitoxin system